jgi:hypothetical protein
MRLGHNNGPPLDDGPLTMDEAQKLRSVDLRPSMVQRYAGRGSPLRPIVALGQLGPLGRWALLSCGHWREIRDYDLIPIRRDGRKQPTKARCGCCRLGYLPDPADLATVAKFLKPA